MIVRLKVSVIYQLKINQHITTMNQIKNYIQHLMLLH